MKIKLFYICAVSIFFTLLNAQTNFRIGTETEYNNNPFRLPVKEESMANKLTFGIQTQIDSITVSYHSNYLDFPSLSDRNYYWHQAGLFREAANYIWGGYFQQRINKANYDFFNFSDVTLYYKCDFETDSLFMDASVLATYTSYSQLNDLNNYLLNSAFSITKSFESKTTLIAQLDMNYKYYPGSALYITSANKKNPYYWHTDLGFRIAQGLFENTGIAIQYNRYFLLSDNAEYVRKMEYSYGDESQLFDDPVSYEGDIFNIQFKQILPFEINMTAVYNYSSKVYKNQGIYLDAEIFANGIIRADKQSYFTFELEKDFDLQNFINADLTINFSYNYILNESNSYWFNYKNNGLTLGIDLQF